MSVSRTDARGGRKDLVELSVDEVEAVIAALGDKVVRLQKDIATLKRTHRFNHSLANADGSHRTTDMPTELTTRKVLRKRISRGIQYNTQDCQQTSYRVTVKCFQQKNSEINNASIKHRQNHRSSNVSKAQKNEARSIDKQRDKSVIWNMDEQTGTEVVVASRREIDDEESRADQVEAGRYATAVDERNRPPVVKTITIPHTNFNEAHTVRSNKHPDRPDRRELDTGVFKSNHGKFVKDDSGVVDKKDKKVKEKRNFGGKLSADEKLNKRKNDDDDAAPKARPILNEENKAVDLDVDDKMAKPFKMSEKEKVNRIASKIKKLSKIKARKNIPDETKMSSAVDETNITRGKSVVKNKKPVSIENNYFEGAQEMKNNSKSRDSMEHPYLSMKKKLNKCTKEIDQFVGKVTDLFQKKSSKSK